MGTYLQLQITARTETAAAAAEATILEAVARLEAAFTRFGPDSDLCRWRDGRAEAPSPELAGLLGLAASWHERSAGAFHPVTAALTARWQQAEDDGVEPIDDELRALVAAVATLPFAVRDDGSVERLGECADVDVHALAKGHVVDLVAAAALDAHELDRLVVNAGGDLLHRGAGVLRVGIEDPHRAYDNVPPMLRIEVADRAVATSGSARRWFAIGDERASRVLDPRTGRPVHRVVGHGGGRRRRDGRCPGDDLHGRRTRRGGRAGRIARPGAECLVIERDGTEHRSPGWSDLEV
ncbi:MAG: FAD:protein FMN transferase [Acidimicrobiales bacterium]